MGNDIQHNKEQFEMLLMTLEEVRHGICLFQSENQAEWVLRIQEHLGKENVITHNIADDNKEMGMAESRDFRKWALQSNANVVVIYNIQVWGNRFGDKEVIENLNYMRDQILAIGKLFVFGMTHFFHRLLSRTARDLYSCILYQFTFREADKIGIEMHGVPLVMMSVDDIFAAQHYREAKEQIQNHCGKSNLSKCLLCMENWNHIRGALFDKNEEFIRLLAEEAEKQYFVKALEIVDTENILILAETWIGLEEADKSVFWYNKILCLVREQLGEDNLIYADVLSAYTNYYQLVGDYITAERLCGQAIQIYQDKQMKYSHNGSVILCRKAVIHIKKSQFAEALEIYKDLLNNQCIYNGEKYYGNGYLYNNIGQVYEKQGDLSSALLQYKKALELFDIAGIQESGKIFLYQNLYAAYLKSGDETEAKKYMEKAKQICEEITI